MSPGEDKDTRRLLRQAQAGDEAAIWQLLEGYRPRLRRMLEVRLDTRLSSRVDPSDIIQDAMLEASQKLPEYLSNRPLPFYPWLRQIAYLKLVDQHRRHVEAEKRTVRREQQWLPLPDHSAMQLASQIFAVTATASERLLQKELRSRIHDALDRLDPADREILVMRHLEQLQVNEVAEILGITGGAVKMRRLRALERLRDMLDRTDEDD